MKNTRSGDIDALRFLFAIMLMVHHLCSSFDQKLIRQGYIGVEFFFVVTGYLAANHIASQQEKMPDGTAASDIWSETWKYIVRKVRQFYGYYLTASFLKFIIVYVLIERHSAFESMQELIHGIPVLTLTFMALNTARGVLYVRGMWYVSAMIIALFILYPCMLYRFSFSTKWLFPILSLVLMGHLYTTYGTIICLYDWDVLTTNGVVRAVAEIAAGASVYALSKWLTEKCRHISMPSPALKAALTACKLICVIVLCLYAHAYFMEVRIVKNEDIYMFLLILILVLLCFLQAGFCIPDNTFTRWMGRASMGVYFFHGLFESSLVRLVEKEGISIRRFALYTGIVFIFSLVMQWIVDLIRNRTRIAKHK